MRCVKISGSDDRMDCREMFYDPINLLPQQCSQCGFPNLDHVPQPYFLVKSRTMSPNELALAENGNFFVRERIRRVLELLAPGQCDYFPTCYKGTLQETPWFLAVPVNQVVTAKVNPAIERCQMCGEPESAHPGTQFTEYLFGTPTRSQPLAPGWTSESAFEILKSSTWGSSDQSWSVWISRDLFLSVQLLHLLKKIKARGFCEATCGKPAAPDQIESAWIKQKLVMLEASGIPFHAEGTLSDIDSKWLREYIKGRSGEEVLNFDLKAVERRLKTKLPKSYLDFITKVGPVSFENVDEQEGFTSSIMTPDKLTLERGSADSDGHEPCVNGVMFATTRHGDCFCFDVQKGKKEFPVVLYKHECDCFEPYAENFAACIRRFAAGD